MPIFELFRLRKRKRSEDNVCALHAPAQSASPSRGATQQMPERLAAAARMFERGIRMSDITHILQIDESSLATALVKRARKGCRLGEPANTQAPPATGGPRRMESLHLAARLQYDPPDLVCPILHSLMEEPVVAEDGYSYERKGIEEALLHRSRSPMTNEPMGEVMLPNLTLRSKIQEYKEVVVAEILSVAPCLVGESPGDAAMLLERAEDLVRPKLPDRAARRKLVDVVLLRTRLPQSHRANAAAELVALLAEDDDSTRLGEVLDRFDSLFDSVSLRSLEEEAAFQLLEVAASQARPTELCSCLGRELVRRAAERLHAAEDEEATAALQKLWQVLVKLCGLEDEAWLEGAAALLASCAERLEPDLPALGPRVLERASELADDSEGLEAAIFHLLGAALPEALVSRGSHAFSAVLLELASRQGDDAAIQTLMRACRLDLESGAGRRSLLALERRRLLAGRQVDEAALVALLHAEGAELPSELLRRLRLEPEAVREAPVPALLALVDRFEEIEGCGPAAARAAVAAAQRQAAEGELAASEETFRRAFALDRHNEAATQGVFEASLAASGRCARLEEQVRRLEEENAELQDRLRAREEALRQALAGSAAGPARARIRSLLAVPLLMRWRGPALIS